LTCTDLRPL